MGRLTKDPEMRNAGESRVANFRIAVPRMVRDGEHPEADFISCVAWNKSADLVNNYFKKGDRIGIEGKIQSRSYKNKDGVEVYATEVVCNNISFIEKKLSPDNKVKEDVDYSNSNEDEDEDYPF